MSSREDILKSISEARAPKCEKPSLDALRASAIHFEDKAAQFAKMLASVGGQCVTLEDGQSVDDLVRSLLPEGGRIASNIPEVSCATFNPDEVEDPKLLDGTDLAVVDGVFGVAENAAVWIEQDVRERALYFISETLVILLDKDALVDNMHEAYARIGDSRPDFGVFISGPSKTADIEQALVFGAHGARRVVVVLR